MRAVSIPARLLILALFVVAIRQLDWPVQAQNDPRYFSETGFRVDNDLIWTFFAEHGGAHAFGPPISRQFKLHGLQTQIFQRHVLRVTDPPGVEVVSLMDSGWMPYRQTAGPPL